MKRLLGGVLSALKVIGLDVKAFVTFLREFPPFLAQYEVLKRQQDGNRDFRLARLMPMLGERDLESGSTSGPYFHQDLLVARRIFEARPERHVDIGSRVDGFVAHVAVFRKIEVFDIRVQHASVPNIIFRQCDMMHLPEEMEGSCDSVSSLHAIEHFGLGRYGDEVDYEGHLKAIDTIHRLLRSGGVFYFSVPIGRQRIEFNAHRVFDVSYLLGVFDGRFRVTSFSYVNDRGDLVEDVVLEEASIRRNFGCSLGCGIFELLKI